MNISNVIKNARLKKELTQKEVARLLGKSKNVVSNWENGLNKPDLDSIDLLCKILNISISDIFNNEKKVDDSIIVLTKEEECLIRYWRELSHDNKMKIIGAIECLNDFK